MWRDIAIGASRPRPIDTSSGSPSCSSASREVMKPPLSCSRAQAPPRPSASPTTKALPKDQHLPRKSGDVRRTCGHNEARHADLIARQLMDDADALQEVLKQASVNRRRFFELV